MPTVHVIHGFIGAGKTTFAKRLEARIGAVRFTPDEMIVDLYGRDLTVEQISDANGRVKPLIWGMACKLLAAGQDVILDYGVWKRDVRDALRADIAAAGAKTQLYHVTCDDALMRERALQRDDAGNLAMTAARYDTYRTRYEPPTEDEAAIVITTDPLNPEQIARVAAEMPLRKVKSLYPPVFAARTEGREKRPLGDAFGLRNFGVNHTTLAPGSQSALLHRHSRQDEFIYILSGTPTLVTEDAQIPLAPGMCAGFPAGGIAHQLVNDSDSPASFLEIGDRTAGDSADYPVDDLRAEMDAAGQWRFTRKDGTSW